MTNERIFRFHPVIRNAIQDRLTEYFTNLHSVKDVEENVILVVEQSIEDALTGAFSRFIEQKTQNLITGFLGKFIQKDKS